MQRLLPAGQKSFTYEYNAASQVTGYTGPEGSLTYAYDNSGQLTGVSGARTETYSFDPNGNRNMTGYVTAASNEMTSDAAGNTYSYDHAGNRTGKTDTSGNVWVFSWDYRNRLTEVTETNSSHTLVLDEKLTYDVNDNLISTKVGSTVQRWTVFDGKNPLLDFNASGSLTTRYLMNPQALDQFFARVSATGTTGWYLTDRLGSVREIVDPTATVLDQISYATYGFVMIETNPSNGDRFKYNGGEFDFNIGLERFDARWTDPIDGRWISQDPLGLGPDSNPYRYCSNSPINLSDPTGLDPIIRLTRGRVLGGGAAAAVTVALILVPNRAQTSAVAVRVRSAVRVQAYINPRTNQASDNPFRRGTFTVTGDDATGIAQAAGITAGREERDFRNNNRDIQVTDFQWSAIITYRVDPQNQRQNDSDVNFTVQIRMTVNRRNAPPIVIDEGETSGVYGDNSWSTNTRFRNP